MTISEIKYFKKTLIMNKPLEIKESSNSLIRNKTIIIESFPTKN